MIRPITAERPLKILGFTDMHLDGNAACARWTLRLMEETVAAEAPDLVIFAGDNVTGGDNRGRAEQLTAVMTALGVPWCPILGNHEGDNPFSVSRREMVRVFRSSPCCLLPEQPVRLRDGRPVNGETNCAVTLRGGGRTRRLPADSPGRGRRHGPGGRAPLRPDGGNAASLRLRQG